jgi:hypothetical protein
MAVDQERLHTLPKSVALKRHFVEQKFFTAKRILFYLKKTV